MAESLGAVDLSKLPPSDPLGCDNNAVWQGMNSDKSTIYTMQSANSYCEQFTLIAGTSSLHLCWANMDAPQSRHTSFT